MTIIYINKISKNYYYLIKLIPIFKNLEKCKIDYGLTSKILCVVITALNGLTVYSARMQAHPVTSYGIRAHFLSTAIKSRQTVRWYERSSRTARPTVRHCNSSGTICRRLKCARMLRASEQSVRYASVCLHFLPTTSPFVRLATVVGCARRICPCAGIKYTRSRSM